MNDLVREKLKFIITTYGQSISADPKFCKVLLRDFCGQYRKEINVLISAIEEGVPEELNNSQDPVSLDLLLARLTKRLENRLAINRDAAKWGVESWAFALGLISGEDESVVKPHSPPPHRQIRLPDPPTIQVERPSKDRVYLRSSRTERLSKAYKSIEDASRIGGTLCGAGVYRLIKNALDGKLHWNFSTLEILIFILVASLLSLGIYNNSRVCAIILFTVGLILTFLFCLGSITNPMGNLLSWGILLCLLYVNVTLFKGILGTFEYHKLT